MGSNVDLVLMDTERISRSLKRMAHEIAERNTRNSPVLLFGIDERGYVIAKDLADMLTPILKEKVESVQLPLEKDNNEQLFNQLKPDKVKKSFLVAVDDVIFSGHTMFTALKKITNHLQPSEIHTAVLIDRGHRKFPIKAEFRGMSLPTKLNEHVSVVIENMNVDKVILEKV
jgi:pyrimidine operon attenuation protein/uracil phosphoribosyltransferase